jgi:hypothetical protein
MIKKCFEHEAEGFAVQKDGQFALIRWFKEWPEIDAHRSCQEFVCEFGGKTVPIKKVNN